MLHIFIFPHYYNNNSINKIIFNSLSRVTRQTTPLSGEVKSITEYEYDGRGWSLYNNCSYFASEVWNTVSTAELDSGSFWNTPSNLADSIMENPGYSNGRNFGVVDSATTYTSANGHSIDSMNSINSASSNSISNGNAEKEINYTDYGNPKEHPKVPHEHDWDWSKTIPRQGGK